MKVKDLIERLQSCDPESIVRVSVYENDGRYDVPIGFVSEYDLTKSLGYKVVDLGE